LNAKADRVVTVASLWRSILARGCLSVRRFTFIVVTASKEFAFISPHPVFDASDAKRAKAGQGRFRFDPFVIAVPVRCSAAARSELRGTRRCH
jgi:hypothetical protein